jgi:hypothetical protein
MGYLAPDKTRFKEMRQESWPLIVVTFRPIFIKRHRAASSQWNALASLPSRGLVGRDGKGLRVGALAPFAPASGERVAGDAGLSIKATPGFLGRDTSRSFPWAPFALRR